MKRRRRLRREVRVTGSALLFGVPMTWALLFAWESHRESGQTGRVSPGQSVRGVMAGLGDQPMPIISLEPRLIPQERDRPVAHTAGYLLPDDGAEDTGHAGR